MTDEHYRPAANEEAQRGKPVDGRQDQQTQRDLPEISSEKWRDFERKLPRNARDRENRNL